MSTGEVDRERHISDLSRPGAATWDEEYYLRGIIDHSVDGIALFDEHGSTIEWNPAYERITGLQRDQVLGRPIWDVQFQLAPAESRTPERYEWIKEFVAQLFQSGQVPQLPPLQETAIQRADGARRIVQTFSFAIPTVHGFRVGAIARDVTQRRRAEDALRESAAKIQGMFDAAADGIVVTDMEGSILDMNRSLIRMFGYERKEEMLGLSTRDMIVATERPTSAERLAETLQAGGAAGVEFSVQRRDGQVLHVEVNAVVLKDAAGHPQQIISVIRDITERRRAEEELRASEERFRSLVQNSSDVITIQDLHGIIRYATPSFERVLGYPLEDVIGHSAFEFVHPDDAARMQADFVAVVDGTNPGTVSEFRARHADGHWMYLESLGSSQLGQPGIEGIVLTTRDITERRHAEEEIKRLNRDLERRARELAALNRAGQAISSTLDLDQVSKIVAAACQSLLEAEAAAVMIYDPAGEALVCRAADGPGSQVMIGIRMPAQNGLTGLAWREKKSILVDDAQEDARFLKRGDTLAGITIRSFLAAPLVVQGAANGVVVVASSEPRVFTLGDRELLETMTVSAAIAVANAQLYEAEREQFRRLQESQARLIQAEKMTALGRLVASIAHEINNPLQVITGSLELIGEEMEDRARPDRMRRYLNTVQGEVDRIAAIVHRLRDFYRPARERMLPTQVDQVLDSVLELAAKQLQNHAVVVERRQSLDLPLVRANPDHLKQVFLNLVLNAVDAMRDEGGTLHVETGLAQVQAGNGRPSPGVRIEFADTGQGMSPEVLDQVFEPFFTTKSGGTGLGLAISYEIIRAHGGEISVASQEGEGTRFTILLPMHIEA